jgi:hypothetical protein
MTNASVVILHKVKRIKYCVASRKIASKRLGIPGCLPCLGLLAAKKRTESTKTSAVTHGVCGAGCEADRNS